MISVLKDSKYVRWIKAVADPDDFIPGQYPPPFLPGEGLFMPVLTGTANSYRNLFGRSINLINSYVLKGGGGV